MRESNASPQPENGVIAGFWQLVGAEITHTIPRRALKYGRFRLRRLRIGNLYAKLVPGYRVNQRIYGHMFCSVAFERFSQAANSNFLVVLVEDDTP